MLVTPDCVLLNLPMTGATLVEEMLRLVYGDRAVDHGRRHAGCAALPADARDKPLLSVFRSPFDRYVSQYHYGCWRQQPGMYCDPARVRAQWPAYPDITFGQFVRIANAHFIDPAWADDGAAPLGWHTEQFVRMYAREPDAARATLQTHAPCARTLDALCHPVHFLLADADGVEAALRVWLRDAGVPATRIALLDDFVPSQPERMHELRLRRDARRYYDAALAEEIRARERWLFERFHPTATAAA